jgi:glycosyltransferase involved in cell wall biosynthesis
VLITVLIPSWNSAHYIARALKSVAETGYSDLEILVMDNESTDGTQQVIAEWNDSRVTCISQKDTGMYEALNRGIERARGEIICWLGADDQLQSTGIVKAVEIFKDNSVQWIVGNGTFLFEQSANTRTSEHHLPRDVTLQRIAYANPLISPSIFFRKVFFDQAGCFNDLWLRFAALSKPYVIHESLSLFSYNGDNVSSKSKIKMYKETITILQSSKVRSTFLARQLNILRMRLYILYNYLTRARV